MKARAPTNIALVKYWGKNPYLEYYNVPTKSSFSIDVDSLYTETEVQVESGNFSISFILNDKVIDSNTKEFSYIESFLKKLSEFSPSLLNYNYFINSRNNFPTAAGFASSASGFAALAKALANEFRIRDNSLFKDLFEDEKKLSTIAMFGSGSASRSIPSKGGFVLWRRGLNPREKADKTEIFKSYSESLFDYLHWNELNLLYLKVSSNEKKIKSRVGMKRSVKTSPFYWNWVDYEEKVVLPRMIKSVEEKNFEEFAELVIRCSDNLHAIMKSSYPSIIYMNDKSKEIVDFVNKFNKSNVKVAYTFDAGANAVLFVEDENVEEVLKELEKIIGGENVVVGKVGKGAYYL